MTGPDSSTAAFTLHPPAKLNLSLHVTGRRSDGFHELDSLVARIDWCDTLIATPRDAPGFAMTCDDPSIPCDDSNLVLRAANALAATCSGRTGGVSFHLIKRIPAGAGLGGGSSDAAAALMLLNELYALRRSPTELGQIGAAIGSDVPLFFSSPLCRMRGRGEWVEPLSGQLDSDVLVIVPPIHSPTASVYSAYARRGARSVRPAPSELLHRATEAAGVIRGAALHPQLYNDLEAAAFEVTPALADFAAALRREFQMPFVMSGSGSAFFTLLPASAPENSALRASICQRFPDARVCLTQPQRGSNQNHDFASFASDARLVS